MRRLAALTFLVASMPSLPADVSAQGLALAAHAGTQGLGGAAVVGVTSRLNLRGSFGVIPADPEFTVEEVDFVTDDFPMIFRATADIYAAGPLFLSVGGLFLSNSGEIGVTGELSGPTEFGEGGATYTPQEVGTLVGVFTLERAMPYVGIGFGNPLGRRVGLTLDLGVGLGSVPTVDVEATGPIASDPAFQQGLAEEEAAYEQDIPSYLQYYPILSLALSVRLGA